jgi:signal peptidase I
MVERESKGDPQPAPTAETDDDHEPSPRRSKRRTVLYTSFGGFLLFLLAVSVFFYTNFKTIEVQGNSMEPTLVAGQRLLVSKAYWLVGAIKEGDIVVINSPFEHEVIIKRVYKTGGGTVDLALVPEHWDITHGKYKVPEGTIYVLGDNLEVSQDSRHYGEFSLKDVLGKVVVVQSSGSPDES